MTRSRTFRTSLQQSRSRGGRPAGRRGNERGALYAVWGSEAGGTEGWRQRLEQLTFALSSATLASALRAVVGAFSAV